MPSNISYLKLQPPIPPLFGDILLGRPEFPILRADNAAAGEGLQESGSVWAHRNLA